jgi:hypothetical protein
VIAQERRFLHARARFGPDMQPHLARVHFGEKILAQKGRQQHDATQKPRKQMAKSSR